MVKRIHEGRLIGIILPTEYSTSQLFRIPLPVGDTSQLYCDAQGNIYRFYKDRKTATMVPLKSVKRSQRKNMYVSIHNKKGNTSSRFLVKYLVALAIFPRDMVRKDRIGHLDNNPINNQISNLYIDLTIKEYDKSFY